MPVFDAEHFATLLGQARGGSSEALGKLLEPFRMHLILNGSCSLHPALQGHVDKNELVQDTLHAGVRSFAQFRGNCEGELFAWLREIMNKQALTLGQRYLNAGKRDVRRQVSLDQEVLGRAYQDLLFDNDETPCTSLSSRERNQIMQQAFEQLCPEHQEVIRLRHSEGKTFEQIAADAGTSAKVISKRWQDALDAWRVAMERFGLRDW